MPISDGRKHPFSVRVADGLGIMHLMVVNIIAAVGCFTPLLSKYGEDQGGMLLIFKTVDYPVYAFILRYAPDGFVPEYGKSLVHDWLVAELIFILSSVIYGVILLFTLRFFAKVIKSLAED